MKLIAIDLDGTLLSHHAEVSETNKAAVFKAQEQGHIVMICSGRTTEDIERIIKRAGITCPVAGSNGAVVRVEGKLLQSISMAREAASSIGLRLDHDRIFYEFYTNEGILMPADWPLRMEELATDERLPKDFRQIFNEHIEKLSGAGLLRFFGSAAEVWEDADLTVQKVNIMVSDPGKRTGLLAFFETLGSGIDVTSSESFNLEVMHRDGHKGNGLKCVADYYGIPLEDTMAIGNSYNDVAMFEMAGLSIAMGNSDQAVKDRCKAVTLSDSEDGVAYALEKYILTN